MSENVKEKVRQLLEHARQTGDYGDCAKDLYEVEALVMPYLPDEKPENSAKVKEGKKAKK